MQTPSSLIDLLDMLRDGDHEFDVTRLPTFGGNEPRNTVGVWSWDQHYLLVADGSDYGLVPRYERVTSESEFVALVGSRDAAFESIGQYLSTFEDDDLSDAARAFLHKSATPEQVAEFYQEIAESWLDAIPEAE